MVPHNVKLSISKTVRVNHAYKHTIEMSALSSSSEKTASAKNSTTATVIHYSAPLGERRMSLSVCLCVCLSASISLEPLDRFSRNLFADPPGRWPWLGPPLAALRCVMYFCWWVCFAGVFRSFSECCHLASWLKIHTAKKFKICSRWQIYASTSPNYIRSVCALLTFAF